ncbi:MAG: TIM barrel protein [Acidobacteria bacterium]|nr:TIM barrel protein [Acidobacteriota bacterium]
MDRRQFLGTGAGAALAAQAQAQARFTSSVMLWTLNGTFEQRMETAAQSGMQSVELVGEHAGWTDAEITAKKKLARSLKLGIDTLIATPNWAQRPVSMVDPAQRDNFLNDVRQAIVYAQKLEVPRIILMSGNEIPERSREAQYASLVEGCRRAGELAAKAGLKLIFEPLNSKVNHKGYFLTTCVEGLRLIKDVDHPHVRLLFDIYHEQVQVGNVIRTLTEAAPYVEVFHIADNPGRNDPGTGEMNYPNIYKAIRKTGYSGYICMEYRPLADPVTSLSKALGEVKAAMA